MCSIIRWLKLQSIKFRLKDSTGLQYVELTYQKIKLEGKHVKYNYQ